MCRLPDPADFENMDRDDKINTLYGAVLKLVARARFTDRVLPVTLTMLILPAIGWVWRDSLAQDARIDTLKDRVEARAVRDSMATVQVLRAIDGLEDKIDAWHSREIRRRK